MVGMSIPVKYSWIKREEDKMTDKQYYCQNGDLIEVGKEYIAYELKLLVVAFHDGKVIVNSDELIVEYQEYDVDEFQSLWQEPEEIEPCLKDIEERLSRLESLMVGDFT